MIMPGSRVLAFDFLLYRDDVSTPLSVTMRPATVVCRYGIRSRQFGIYPDLVDLIFDHRPDEIRSNFTNGLKEIAA